MKHHELRRGDPCPLCGQGIETDDPEVLRLLSVIAAHMNYEWPEENEAENVK